VPEGRGSAFEAAFALIPAHERVTFVEHRVARGETLSHIALQYGVRVADLQAANPGVRPLALRIGALLTVPVAPSTRAAAAGG
jgi:membrane-bound lytic murein transglycosylase D